MQSEPKFSRFMFHLKFSSTEDYVNEHELYEVMRSRNLYQSQFGVKTHYKKTIRNLAIAEKAERYGFENNRKLFVQQMRERREQADKVRLATSSLKPRGDKRLKKIERHYVPIPQSTTIYSDLPAIVQIERANSPPASVLSDKSEHRHAPNEVLPDPPAQDVVAPTAVYVDIADGRKEDLHPTKAIGESKDSHILPTKALVATPRGEPTSVIKAPVSKEPTGLAFPLLPEIHQHRHLIDTEQCSGSMDRLNKDQDDDFVKKTKKGRGKMLVSTAQMTDAIPPPSEQPPRRSRRHESTDKCEQWRERNGLATSKDNLQSSSQLRRLKPDRPSKFTLSHVNDERARLMDAIDLRYKMIQKLAKELDNSRKQIGRISEKLQLSSQHYMSLDADATPKPMVTMDPGGTTPDGRLILTQTDYDEYLAGFRRARDVRLKNAKRHEEDVGKQVDDFKIGSDLRLREPTRVTCKDGLLVLRAL